MKRYLAVFFIVIIFMTGLLAETGVSYSADVVSRYIWRGWDLTPNNRPALQPAVSCACGNFEMGVWSSFALIDRSELKSADECDLYFAYAWDVKKSLNCTFGLTYYTFPNTDDFSLKDATSPEPFFTIDASEILFNPAMSIFYDLNLGDGFYILLSGEYSLEMFTKIFNFSTSCGYNNGQFGADPGISDIVFSVNTEFEFSWGTLTPSFNVAVIPEETVNDENEIWIGLSFAR